MTKLANIIRNMLFWAIMAPALLTTAEHAYAAQTYSVETTITETTDDLPDAALILPAPTTEKSLAHYGPFDVVADNRAVLNGTIETGTVRQFQAMLRAFPNIKQIDMIECPGTDDDEANFAIAHIIHSKGITTYVPNGGSVRSGGVELFLAGTQRRADSGAEFAVHSWRDEQGHEPADFADSDPVNQEYIHFYKDVGMSEAKAKAFYALTNSVPADDALYLGPRDIARYIALN